MEPTRLQKLGAIQETQLAVRSIRAGVRELHLIDGVNDFYYLPFQMLSGGFERLMKMIICFHILENSGAFPKRGEFGRGAKGHRLEPLLERVLDECAPPRFADIPMIRNDVNFVRRDEILNKLIGVLSRFGERDRYYYLDLTLGEDVENRAPDVEWESLETDLLREDPNWVGSLQADPTLERTYATVNYKVTYRIERLARTLARFFTHGNLGSLAGTCSQPVMYYALLDDEDLGVTRGRTGSGS